MGTLYVVATPIGNLEDITLRALRVLREVQLIAAEDTRRTAKLLQHYSIATPTTSLHEHNEAQKGESLLLRLREGAAIALVSDAGTPLVSDPGRQFVRRAREDGHSVVAIPGASAVMTILAAAGVDASEFTFLGFPPRRSNDLRTWLERRFGGDNNVVVFFEAPHRVRTTLQAMQLVLGNRPIIVGRELTKLHEELVEEPISAALARFANPRGEFTIIVETTRLASATEPADPGDDSVIAEIGQLIESGIATRAAAKAVATKYGRTANAVYRLWAESKRLVK